VADPFGKRNRTVPLPHTTDRRYSLEGDTAAAPEDAASPEARRGLFCIPEDSSYGDGGATEEVPVPAEASGASGPHATVAEPGEGQSNAPAATTARPAKKKKTDKVATAPAAGSATVPVFTPEKTRFPIELKAHNRKRCACLLVFD